LREAAAIYGGSLPPELEELDCAEEQAMARRASAHANNGNMKAGIKVNALLIMHQVVYLRASSP